MTTEVINLVDIKFSIDVGFLVSTIFLQLITNVSPHNALLIEQVRENLQNRFKKPNDIVTLE